ncbi:hypothetical protein EKO27_g6229 [Xylaria grammica]|uniref:Protein kinase domain-containing protein n=1 Tax=Xylaria grammica TaxID=363999 RepID=A0A439D335_9PEZI|nr:hypothetical protein EKO27_g6229 [Xylaria grammica]
MASEGNQRPSFYEFEEKVSNINTLINDLEGFTVNASESQSLQRALPSMSLKHITNTKSSETVLTIDQLRFLQTSTRWYRGPPAAPEYIRRIKVLGYLLEKASDPVLRLPVCHGIFDDLAYEAEFGARRIGYVFSAPQASHNPSSALPVPTPPSLPVYGRNFPFSYFHSAGWLHKGFHSGNIIFLAQDSGQEGTIRATDPFITGFQYSRPVDSHSLSRDPLGNGDLEHYYHPSAEKGFSRRIDL